MSKAVKLSLGLLLALSITLIGLPVFADGLIQGISFTGGDGSYKKAVREGVVAAISPASYPHTFINPATKQPDGIDVNIFQEVARRLDIKVTWQSMPFGSMVPALLSHRVDVMVDDLHMTPARLKIMAFTSPIPYYGFAMAVRRQNAVKISSWEALAGHTVGALQGGIQYDTLMNRKDLRQLTAYQFSEAALTDLGNGRIDAVVDDELVIRAYVKKHPGTDIVIPPAGVTSLPSRLQLGQARYGIRQDDVDLNNAISRALAEMIADGTMMKIISQYGMTTQSLVGGR